MRIWLNPDKLAAMSISPAEVNAALAEQNIQIAAGSIGATPQTSKQAFEYNALTNSRIKLSATARTQLLGGGIDPRLPVLIAAMVNDHPMRIVDFGGWSPGGGPASLLRLVDVATVNRDTHLSPAAYVRWMLSFIRVQRAEYRHARSLQVTLPDGQAALRIEYLAPSPLS